MVSCGVLYCLCCSCWPKLKIITKTFVFQDAEIEGLQNALREIPKLADIQVPISFSKLTTVAGTINYLTPLEA
jgi:hypothetical protein